MKKNQAAIYIGVIALGVLSIVGGLVFTPRKKIPSVSPSVQVVSPSEETIPTPAAPLPRKITAPVVAQKGVSSPSITLTAGTATISLPLSSGTSLVDVLRSASAQGLISFAGKQYPGLGFFVTDIGSLHQGEGKYLVYSINGTEASVGVSSSIPKNGDAVVWELK